MPWRYDNVEKILVPVDENSIFSRTVDDVELSRLLRKNRKALISSMDRHDKDAFYHVSLYPIEELVLKPDKRRKITSFLANVNYFNPNGLWIARGADWIRWIPPAEEFVWNLCTHIYEVIPSDTVLRIRNEKQFFRFIDTYRDKTCKTHECVVDWKRVQQDWDGLIISPYLGEKLLGKDASLLSFWGDPRDVSRFYKKMLGKDFKKHPAFLSQWYRHWEVASGVIWNNRGIKEFRLHKKLNTFDHLYSTWGRFVDRVSAFF